MIAGTAYVGRTENSHLIHTDFCLRTLFTQRFQRSVRFARDFFDCLVIDCRYFGNFVICNLPGFVNRDR